MKKLVFSEKNKIAKEGIFPSQELLTKLKDMEVPTSKEDIGINFESDKFNPFQHGRLMLDDDDTLTVFFFIHLNN